MSYRGVLAAALAAATLACGGREPDGVALVGATVIDGTGGPVLRDAVIVVRGSTIDTVAPRAGFEIPDGIREVNAAGRWIIPGLIDAHVHTARWALPRYLAYGVTTVRDVHGQLDSAIALRESARRDSVMSPRVYSAGSMIDAAPGTYSDALVVTTPDEARAAVDQLAIAGLDFVKTYTRMAPPLLSETVDEARTFGLDVTAHLGLTDAVTAAQLGVVSIEHLSGVPEAAASDPAPFYRAHGSGFFRGWTYFERSWAGLAQDALTRVARELAERDVTLIPTLVLHDTYSRPRDPAVAESPDLVAVPDAERIRWNTAEMIERAGWTDGDFAAFRRSRANQDFFVRQFQALGGVLATGTDSPNQLLVPGASLHRELELLVAAGLTPADALRAATRNGALLLHADSLGMIAPGMVADLVVLSEDPLLDIRNTRAVEQVMIRGRLLPVDSIRAAW